ncbi:hypothetical protein MAPG_01519 [Magnaporthiopsis poae ATCC 64411]|uniref:Zn(2)-C6 fungal-type domain-containing protein n=1 Tax=Magnaporthiopsis poae (strain ATCC 64411 / 73-15) TaxID=644358 RepID=A0A0C4DNX2_MAGP6|nr:hypothetical protein MAPG_01519 [Magnaporthiopsis poae ATCC 64411]
MDNALSGPDPARGSQPPSETARRRRRRQALTCETCRKRKVKCDRLQPCSNCIRAQRPAECHYQAELLLPRRPSAARPPATPGALAPLPALQPPSRTSEPSPEADTSFNQLRHNPHSPATPSTNQSGKSEVVLLAERVKDLEKRLAQTLATAQPNISGPPTIDPPLKGPDQSKGRLFKTHYYGQSHWMHIAPLFTVVTEIFSIPPGHPLAVSERVRKCKSLARLIKSARIRALDEPGNSEIPSREICDQLVAAYMRTFETVYRILHIPTFYRDYHKYWEDPAGRSDAFVNQLKLVLAIGACFHDDAFKMRNLSARWIQEAHSWLLSPLTALKSRLVLTTLQTMCLLHLARQTTGSGGDLVWISAGEVVRMAIYMGLHRDPDHLSKMSRLRAELRRRLWATIMEIALQASIDVGGPAAISLSDFDTRPPSNLEDADLEEHGGAEPGGESLPGPRPVECFTQTSVQIALYRSFPTRLAIAQYVNDFRRVSCYNTTLRLNADLTTAIRGLSRVLSSFRDRGLGRPSEFQILLVEHVMHSFSLALHLPWTAASQRDPHYYFSRKVSVETALKLPRALASDDHKGARPEHGGCADFRRLSTCGAGTYRMLPWQCSMTLGLELLWQAEDNRVVRAGVRQNRNSEMSLPEAAQEAGHVKSPPQPLTTGLGVAPSTELIAALRGIQAWASRRIAAGETNIRGSVLIAGILVQEDAIRRGDGDDEVLRRTAQAMMDEAAVCYGLLKDMAVRLDINPDPIALDNGADANKPADPATHPHQDIGDGESVSHDVDTTTTSSPGEKFLAFGGIAAEGLPLGMETGWTWDDFMDIEGLDFNFANGSDPNLAQT